MGLVSTSQLGTTETTIYQNNTTKPVKIMSLNLCNTGSVGAVFTIYAYPSSMSAGSDSNTFYKSVDIAGMDTFEKELGNFVLSPGDKISGISTVPNVITPIVSIFEL